MTDNKLRTVKDSVHPWPTSSRVNRQEEVVLARLRIGHTQLTLTHLISGDPTPFCDGCLVPLTVVHMLIECPDYNNKRRRAFRCWWNQICHWHYRYNEWRPILYGVTFALPERMFPNALFVTWRPDDWWYVPYQTCLTSASHFPLLFLCLVSQRHDMTLRGLKCHSTSSLRCETPIIITDKQECEELTQTWGPWYAWEKIKNVIGCMS